jgi:AraC family transcriptional regulator
MEAKMVSSDAKTGYFGTPLLELRSGPTFVTEHVYRPFQQIARHQHDHPYICVVLCGRYRERSEAGDRDCKPGSVLIHPAGSTHSDRFADVETRLLMVELDQQRDGFAVPQLFDSGPAAALGARLHEEAMRADEATPLAIEGLTLELMAVSWREQIRRSARPPRWLLRARDRIDGALPGRVAIRDLAAEAGVHPAHFSRAFRAHFGGTVADYLRRRRVEKAEEIIARGDSLVEAALEAGFADQSHLTRAFRRVSGVTPAQFAAARNAGYRRRTLPSFKSRAERLA